MTGNYGIMKKKVQMRREILQCTDRQDKVYHGIFIRSEVAFVLRIRVKTAGYHFKL